MYSTLGWAGRGCNSECSENGVIEEGACNCFYESGFRGDVCDIPGCPGLNDVDCSGKGGCNSAEAHCVCNPGWEGIGCETGDCSIFGEPDCSGHGQCVDDFELELPYCECESNFFELDCRCTLVTPVSPVRSTYST